MEMKSGFLSQGRWQRNRMEGMNGGVLVILPLDQVCLDVWAWVISVDTDLPMKQRLRDFGLVPGTQVRRRYADPGGDLSAIELRGSVIALRRPDVHRIRVRV
jgi:Fe2+ transport system protein FeoA